MSGAGSELTSKPDMRSAIVKPPLVSFWCTRRIRWFSRSSCSAMRPSHSARFCLPIRSRSARGITGPASISICGFFLGIKFPHNDHNVRSYTHLLLPVNNNEPVETFYSHRISYRLLDVLHNQPLP